MMRRFKGLYLPTKFLWLFSTKIHQRRRQRRRLSIDSRREPRREREMSYSPKMGAIIYVLWLVVTCYKTEREKNGYCSSTKRFTTDTLVARKPL